MQGSQHRVGRPVFSKRGAPGGPTPPAAVLCSILILFGFTMACEKGGHRKESSALEGVEGG